MHPNGGTVELLAAFQDGLFASTNGGNTFAAVTLPSTPAAAWTRLAVDRVADGAGCRLCLRRGRRRGASVAPQRHDLDEDHGAVDARTSIRRGTTGTSPRRRTASDQVYIGAIDTLRGDLSGSTWNWTNITTQGANSIHPDQHCLTFAPGNSKIIYAGNDGGIYRSTNSGGTWSALNKGLAITEIEYMASDPNTWKWLMAGTQDNGTIRFTGATEWDHIADGDGGDCGVDQQNPNTVYHSYLQRLARTLEQQGQQLDVAGAAERRSLFYPPVEVAGLTVADRREFAGGHAHRRSAVDDCRARSLRRTRCRRRCGRSTRTPS